VPQLDSDVSVSNTSLKKMCCAEMAQLVEVHSRPTKQRSHGPPVVQVRALREAPAAWSGEQPRDVDLGRNVGKNPTCRRREDHDALLAVLGTLDVPRPVETLSDDDFVASDVRAL
jgi:hypothetical protein